jgi:hypothetical protein
MKKLAALILIAFLTLTSGLAGGGLPRVQAQEPTEEPTTATEEPSYARYAEIEGVTVRWEYVITAGDIMTAGLLLVLLASLWIFTALFFIGKGSKRG